MELHQTVFSAEDADLLEFAPEDTDPKVIQSALDVISSSLADDYSQCVAIGQVLKGGVKKGELSEGEAFGMFHRFCNRSS